MLSNAEIEGIFTQEALRVYFIADGVDIPFSIYAYKYLCRYRYARKTVFLTGGFCIMNLEILRFII